MDLKTRIEDALSAILSDKHECKITLRFERKEKNEYTTFNTDNP